MRIVAALMGISLIGVVGCADSKPAPAAVASASSVTPPGIKVGAKVELNTNHGSGNAVGELFVVEEINGHWVRVKGKGFGTFQLQSYWVNFENVIWYDIKG